MSRKAGSKKIEPGYYHVATYFGKQRQRRNLEALNRNPNSKTILDAYIDSCIGKRGLNGNRRVYQCMYLKESQSNKSEG